MRQLVESSAQSRGKRSNGALSAVARKRQNRVVALWLCAIAVTFVLLLVAANGARAATATDLSAPTSSPNATPGPAPLQPLATPTPVAPDPLQCVINASTENGMVSITIGNSSQQAIDKNRLVYYEMGIATDEPLHGVRAPITVLTGGAFSELVPVQGDLHAGACRAWIYKPLQALPSAQ